MAPFQALRHRPFALLWTGETLSWFGEQIYQVALLWWVAAVSGDAAVLGAILTFNIAPSLVMALLGGLLVDRLPRLPIIRAYYVARALVAAALAALAWSGRLSVAHLYVASAVGGLAYAAFYPASIAVLPEVVPRTDLLGANALNLLATRVSGIAGPLLGAVLVQLFGTPLAFAVFGAAFALAGLAVSPLCSAARPPRPAARISDWRIELRDGLHRVARAPWLWVAIVVGGAGTLGWVATMVALPFLVREHWQASVGMLGTYRAFASTGYVASALLLGWLRRRRHPAHVLYLAWSLVGVGLATLGAGWARGPRLGLAAHAGIMAVAAAIGSCNAVVSILWMRLLQERVRPAMLGRVTSIDYLGTNLLDPLGYMLGGWATERYGPARVFVLGGAWMAAIMAVGLLHPGVREVDADRGAGAAGVPAAKPSPVRGAGRRV